MITSPASPGEPRPAATARGLRLLDLAALVLGYSLASLGLRSFWPREAAAPALPYALATVTFAWLGLALSGPFVLLLHRKRPRDRDRARYTGAEIAWLLIGGYWMSFTLLVIPVHVIPPTFGLLPILAAGVAWLAAPRSPDRTPNHENAWTHRAAVLLLVTWPLAWASMMLFTHVLY